ncbi:7-deoxyloganetin glucosyltransferase-like isoform X2 [Diospyros lotus]|uniref:7-deoxyloganetin glucosyltransferase-like isoform X2 n=1 Tax=Diospyros lotus TaxID=55363 RepID=UPI002257E880|nr:7-deoxyloganetin glucosyltransferase-like isoform X2 [Diospyros lotus]
MSSRVVSDKPHAVCIPFPHQSHMKASLKLAKLLHHKGFHITFVNTEFNHKQFLKSRGPDFLDGLPDFQFQTIPDGLPPSDSDVSHCQDGVSLCQSLRSGNFLVPFRSLLAKLNDSASSNIPPVTCVVSDGFFSTFTITAAEDLGIPVILFWTVSACGFMGFYHYRALLEKGLAPLKDWIQGMKYIRLKDLPTLCRITDANDPAFNLAMEAAEGSSKALANVIHTFDALEQDVLDALSSMFPHVYTIGPLQLLLNNSISEESQLKSIGYSLWKEEPECLQWLDSKEPESVIYVNFGSIVVMTPRQLVEFSWGLANSRHSFLWIIRPDLVAGDNALILPPEFVAETKERGLLASWCPQEQVLNHPSVGGFLTHSGWNSILESLSAGVPMICWPVLADQQTNCRYANKHWGIGMEIDNDVKRDEVERLIREIMGGEQGMKMKMKAREWKKMAEEATGPDGSSSMNLDKLVKQLSVSKV